MKLGKITHHYRSLPNISLVSIFPLLLGRVFFFLCRPVCATPAAPVRALAAHAPPCSVHAARRPHRSSATPSPKPDHTPTGAPRAPARPACALAPTPQRRPPERDLCARRLPTSPRAPRRHSAPAVYPPRRARLPRAKKKKPHQTLRTRKKKPSGEAPARAQCLASSLAPTVVALAPRPACPLVGPTVVVPCSGLPRARPRSALHTCSKN